MMVNLDYATMSLMVDHNVNVLATNMDMYIKQNPALFDPSHGWVLVADDDTPPAYRASAKDMGEIEKAIERNILQSVTNVFDKSQWQEIKLIIEDDENKLIRESIFSHYDSELKIALERTMKGQPEEARLYLNERFNIAIQAKPFYIILDDDRQIARYNSDLDEWHDMNDDISIDDNFDVSFEADQSVPLSSSIKDDYDGIGPAQTIESPQTPSAVQYNLAEAGKQYAESQELVALEKWRTENPDASDFRTNVEQVYQRKLGETGKQIDKPQDEDPEDELDALTVSKKVDMPKGKGKLMHASPVPTNSASIRKIPIDIDMFERAKDSLQNTPAELKEISDFFLNNSHASWGSSDMGKLKSLQKVAPANMFCISALRIHESNLSQQAFDCPLGYFAQVSTFATDVKYNNVKFDDLPFCTEIFRIGMMAYVKKRMQLTLTQIHELDPNQETIKTLKARVENALRFYDQLIENERSILKHIATRYKTTHLSLMTQLVNILKDRIESGDLEGLDLDRVKSYLINTDPAEADNRSKLVKELFEAPKAPAKPHRNLPYLNSLLEELGMLKSLMQKYAKLINSSVTPWIDGCWAEDGFFGNAHQLHLLGPHIETMIADINKLHPYNRTENPFVKSLNQCLTAIKQEIERENRVADPNVSSSSTSKLYMPLLGKLSFDKVINKIDEINKFVDTVNKVSHK